MKKSYDDSLNRSREDSPTLAAYGLRRVNVRGTPTTFIPNIQRGPQGAYLERGTLRQNGNSVDSWHSSNDDSNKTGKPYYWGSDTKSEPITNRSNDSSYSTSNLMYTSVSSTPPSPRHQKIVPSGYAPHRFPVSISYTARPKWPATYNYTPSFTAPNTMSLPSTRVTSGLPQKPATSAYSTERNAYAKKIASSSGSSTVPNNQGSNMTRGMNYQSNSSSPGSISCHESSSGSGSPYYGSKGINQRVENEKGEMEQKADGFFHRNVLPKIRSSENKQLRNGIMKPTEQDRTHTGDPKTVHYNEYRSTNGDLRGDRHVQSNKERKQCLKSFYCIFLSSVVEIFEFYFHFYFKVDCARSVLCLLSSKNLLLAMIFFS